MINCLQRYLPSLDLSSKIKATSDMQDIESSDTVIFCVPSDAFREVSELASSYIQESSYLITATKGVEKEGFSLMSQILEEHYPANSIGVISGPNLAEEIAEGQLSGTVIASQDATLRNSVIKDLSNNNIDIIFGTHKRFPNMDKIEDKYFQTLK